MVARTVYLTPEGKVTLQQELQQLLEQREVLLNRIQEERNFGAFAEGSEPDADKIDLAFVEGRILTIENQLREAVILNTHDASHVSLGATVTLVDASGAEERYTIVGSPEAKPTEGRISNVSPVGRAVLGKRVGDTVSINVPSGTIEYTVKAIS